VALGAIRRNGKSGQVSFVETVVITLLVIAAVLIAATSASAQPFPGSSGGIAHAGDWDGDRALAVPAPCGDWCASPVGIGRRGAESQLFAAFAGDFGQFARAPAGTAYADRR